jgi:iron complex transport system permease protein
VRIGGRASAPGSARFAWSLAIATLVLLLLVAASFAVGPYALSPVDVAQALGSAIARTPSGLPPNVDAVVTQLRAPRIAAAIAVGASLAAAGAAYQALFRNPLVSPDILGVSAGSAAGASIALLNAMPAGVVQLCAFGGGIGAVAAVVAVATAIRGPDRLLTLVLTGVVVGSLFGAAVALVKALADPASQLPALTFWLMGSFSAATPRDVAVALAPMAAGIAALWMLRWRIDVLTLSRDEAASLGVAVTAVRGCVIVAATLATAAAVALAGTIGWVGLLVPHAARLLAGAAFARVLPLALVLGAAFMLAVDTACRATLAVEMPPGIVTALVGTPLFIALLAASLRRAP